MRPRLIERLDYGTQGPLTLVAAAAGYGKTTLVSLLDREFRRRNEVARRPVAWITLDERARVIYGLFLRYFIASVTYHVSRRCATTSRPGSGHAAASVSTSSARTFINEIAAIPQDFILVLDDYHLINGTGVPGPLESSLRGIGRSRCTWC